ncbi:MAG: 6-carboxytetrahydropterin synthase QueD [Alphaproteobacteria bacterium]
MTGRLEITKTFSFEAAHHFRHMPEGHPYRRLHGHSFVAEVTLSGAPDPETGWVADFAEVDRALDEVRAVLDHHLLNEIEGLENPSLENLAMWIARQLRPALPALTRVTVRRPSCGEACTFTLD